MDEAPETGVLEDEGCEAESESAGLTELPESELAEVSETTTDEGLDEDLDAEAATNRLETFLAPGGGWGGSELPVRRAIRIAQRNGLTVTSLKRSSGSSGSDHHTSQRVSFAADLSNSTRPSPQMLATARAIAAAMGYSWPQNGYINTATTSRGYRAQLIYNSSVVSGHHNHVHFGVRKVR